MAPMVICSHGQRVSHFFFSIKDSDGRVEINITQQSHPSTASSSAIKPKYNPWPVCHPRCVFQGDHSLFSNALSSPYLHITYSPPPKNKKKNKMRFTSAIALLASLTFVATLAKARPTGSLLNSVPNSCNSVEGTTSTCCASIACEIMKCNCAQLADDCAGSCAGDCLNDRCITACSNRCDSQFRCNYQACTAANYSKFGIRTIQQC